MKISEFEWDQAKAIANFAKHGLRFETATAIFDDPWRIDVDVSRTKDKEQRRKIIGAIEGRIISVVYTHRKDAVRLISARRANEQEERAYANNPL